MAFRQTVVLGNFDKRVDYTDLVKAFGEKLVYQAKMRFDRLEDPDGAAWAPLKHPRPSSRGADRPLNDSGLLRTSLVPGALGSVYEIGPAGIRYGTQVRAPGTNAEYGPTHQYGATIRPKNAKFLAIPATKDAARVGSPRRWKGEKLRFKFGKIGGVAVTGPRLAEVVQYYFTKQVVIPARPFMGINNAQADELAEMAGEFTRAALLKM